MTDQQDLASLSIKDLRHLAGEHLIHNRSRLGKEELIQALKLVISGVGEQLAAAPGAAAAEGHESPASAPAPAAEAAAPALAAEPEMITPDSVADLEQPAAASARPAGAEPEVLDAAAVAGLDQPQGGEGERRRRRRRRRGRGRRDGGQGFDQRQGGAPLGPEGDDDGGPTMVPRATWRRTLASPRPPPMPPSPIRSPSRAPSRCAIRARPAPSSAPCSMATASAARARSRIASTSTAAASRRAATVVAMAIAVRVAATARAGRGAATALAATALAATASATMASSAAWIPAPARRRVHRMAARTTSVRRVRASMACTVRCRACSTACAYSPRASSKLCDPTTPTWAQARLSELLAETGVVPMPASGQPHPDYHTVVGTAVAADVAPGAIAIVESPGFALRGDRGDLFPLRKAQVRIAAGERRDGAPPLATLDPAAVDSGAAAAAPLAEAPMAVVHDGGALRAEPAPVGGR